MTLEVGMPGRWGRRQGAALGGALAMLCAFAIWAQPAAAVAPQITKVGVSAVTSTAATFKAEINPQGIATQYHFEYGAAGPCESNPCASVPSPEGELPIGSSPTPVAIAVEGLLPGTVYHFRAVAANGEVAKSPDRVFATFSSPSVGLPDGRAYEQASPVDKNGGDAVGAQALVKASVDGEGITFGSTFGIPGGVGAQELPLYLGSRQGGAGWSTQGLLPPATLGQRALVLGWLPDYSETFAEAAKLGNPFTTALFALSSAGKAPVMIAPYVGKAEYDYAGASKDASTVAFESKAPLPADPAAVKDAPNVYAWDRATEELKLASVFNDGASPPKGALAGPYDFSRGTTASSLREGGGASAYYLQEERAVTASGDVYFTAAVSGQLYLRLNPTEEQSPLDGEGKCTEPALACTIHVSASQKTNGQGGGADPAGPQPAAFQAASADGSAAFFTSSEKLTDDANTGPEQPAAAIGIGGIGGGVEDAGFIPAHAVGVAVDSEHIYWADPAAGAIGRADIDGDPGSVEPTFIAPGPTECEVEPEAKPGVFTSFPSKPRYVAVDAGHLYWTNTGCLDKQERPLEGGGAIGRADIEGSAASIESAFIEGASDPQGIAVNATHIYWANKGGAGALARATIEGGEVNQALINPGSQFPIGVALSPTHVYFSVGTGGAESEGAFVSRVPLAGGAEEFVFIANTSKLRGIAVDGANVYWAAQAEGAIGRIPIADFPKLGPCEAVPSCDKSFTAVQGALNGLAADASHLYWSVNGEAPTNPGNDLYRYEPNFAEPGEAGTLTDLTADPDTENGAEAQGVVGAAADGSRVYFVANAVLDDAEEAAPGDCHGPEALLSGACNLYLWEAGAITFVARMKGGLNSALSDGVNWLGTPLGIFGSNATYVPKSARTSEDGATLLFRAQEKLSEYDNEGVPELYRFRVGDPEGIRCVSCAPSGEAAAAGPSLGSVAFPGMPPRVSLAAVSSRNLSADGNRAFFESAEALVPADTNDQGDCSDLPPSCLDTYEWEAPGSGSCKAGAEAYSPLNDGCIYLISTGKSEFPSFFADASASGSDVFFFTRQRLVGQDTDELQDVYDARVGGGLASQNPPPPPICASAESCHGPVAPAPAESSPGSATFVGPGNPVPKHKAQKATKKKHKAKKHKKAKKQKRANAKGRASR